MVEAGLHTVSETPNAAYSTSIACVDLAAANPANIIASCTNCTSLDVTTPDAQSDIVCTVTNTLIDLCIGVVCEDNNSCTTDSWCSGPVRIRSRAECRRRLRQPRSDGMQWRGLL